MYVKVRVTPGAKKERVLEVSKDVLAIQVKEPNERNEANDRVRVIVAEHYSVRPAQVKMLSGFRSPNKLFSID